MNSLNIPTSGLVIEFALTLTPQRSDIICLYKDKLFSSPTTHRIMPWNCWSYFVPFAQNHNFFRLWSYRRPQFLAFREKNDCKLLQCYLMPIRELPRSFASGSLTAVAINALKKYKKIWSSSFGTCLNVVHWFNILLEPSNFGKVSFLL